MTNEKGRKHLPPYVSYRTFHNFLEQLQQRLPSRIDRSFWGERFSGSTGTQLVAALRFLDLIDANGKPTAKLRPLVVSRGEQRSQLLHNVTNEAFSFVTKSSLDLQNATYAQLEEVFHHTFQVADNVSRKCVKFFIAMAGEAGIPISPFITRRTRTAHSTTGTKISSKRTAKGTNRNSLVPQVPDEIPNNSSWHSLLLAKFPNFDPSWSDEIKTKWFAAFDELLKKGLIRG